MARKATRAENDDGFDPEIAGDDRLYRAPALEKGLDVLELLASEESPLTTSAIVQRLGRSTGELFRMIHVLEHRGFVAQGPNGEGYSLTPKLFEMGMERPPLRNLVEIAVPLMRQLSKEIGQSCHLALPSNGHIVVVARMESREQIGFSVRVGYRRPIHVTASGAVLYAFQPDDVRAFWDDMLDPGVDPATLVTFRARAEQIRARGYLQAASGFIAGITDISAPVLRGDNAAAALSVPFVKSFGRQVPMKEVVQRVLATTAEISKGLLQSDARV